MKTVKAKFLALAYDNLDAKSVATDTDY